MPSSWDEVALLRKNVGGVWCIMTFSLESRTERYFVRRTNSIWIVSKWNRGRRRGCSAFQFSSIAMNFRQVYQFDKPMLLPCSTPRHRMATRSKTLKKNSKTVAVFSSMWGVLCYAEPFSNVLQYVAQQRPRSISSRETMLGWSRKELCFDIQNGIVKVTQRLGLKDSYLPQPCPS